MKLASVSAISLFCLNLLWAAQPLDKVVAVVNDSVITQSEIEEKLAIAKGQLQAQNIPLPEDKILRKQVLEQLILLDLQRQLAKANDLNIDDTELNEALERVAKSNHMRLEELKQAISKEGLTWDEYRKNFREEMLIHQLQQKTVARDVVVTNEQVEDFIKGNKQNQNNDAVYVLTNLLIPLPDEPSSEQLRAAREKAQAILAKAKNSPNLQQLSLSESNDQWLLEHHDLGERHLAQLPEIFAREVTQMQKGEIRGPIRAGNGLQLIQLMDKKEQSQKHIVTKTHVRHILIKQNAGTTLLEAEKRVHNLYQQLKSGKNFAEIARKYSVDPASASKGGDLGWVGPGELVPEFEQAMDQLAAQQISQPVKSVFGWHLIQVLDRKQVDDSESWQKQQVRQFLFQRKFSEALQTWQHHLRTQAYIKIMDKDLA
ncbi:MAG: peptidylprolyl isomerase [Legionellaceae bacterium]|nr:peptidylprolyl isomerase [Legionellaceae bacterium]